MLILLMWLFIYAMLAMALAILILPNAHWLVELLYYAIAGMAWIIPVKYLIQWMNRPDEPAPGNG
jgi:hypothetical protein